MEKILKEWKEFVAEAKDVKQFSTRTRIIVKKPEGAAAVIDDTLALIRAIPSITVVNSETDPAASTPTKAIIELEFKFIPRSSSLEKDVREIKKDILSASSLILGVSPIKKMLSSLRRVEK
jgi:ribosome-binding ATPase YchF (GTP1/OBG family)